MHASDLEKIQELKLKEREAFKIFPNDDNIRIYVKKLRDTGVTRRYAPMLVLNTYCQSDEEKRKHDHRARRIVDEVYS